MDPALIAQYTYQQSFLLVDLNMWTFWNVQGWTVLFALVGLMMLAKGSCKACMKKR